MLEGVGLGLAGPSFVTAYFSPGVNPRSPPARIRRSRRVQLRWSGLSHPWVKLLGVGLSHRSGRLEHDALGNDALRRLRKIIESRGLEEGFLLMGRRSRPLV